jgi:hypothetical protein
MNPGGRRGLRLTPDNLVGKANRHRPEEKSPAHNSSGGDVEGLDSWALDGTTLSQFIFIDAFISAGWETS